MNSHTLLLRQIHPSFVQDGRVSSQAFRPTPKDECQLSVYDGDRITAEDSWRHFTANPVCRSQGVMAVAKAKCDELSLAVFADGVPFPEHASIDFTGLAKGEVERKAKILAQHARQLGWLYQNPA